MSYLVSICLNQSQIPPHNHPRKVPRFPFAEGGGIGLLMEEVISQELYHIALFQEHLQVLVGCLGPASLSKVGT